MVRKLKTLEESLANMQVIIDDGKQADSVQITVASDVVEVDASGRKKSVDITHEQLEEKGLKNKSQVIRYLDAEGYTRSAIAMFLNVRYQHVRNVLVTPLKKGG